MLLQERSWNDWKKHVRENTYFVTGIQDLTDPHLPDGVDAGGPIG